MLVVIVRRLIVNQASEPWMVRLRFHIRGLLIMMAILAAVLAVRFANVKYWQVEGNAAQALEAADLCYVEYKSADCSFFWQFLSGHPERHVIRVSLSRLDPNREDSGDTEKLFRLLRKLPCIETLEINGDGVRDEHTKQLCGHSALRELALRNTRITGVSLRYVATLPRLFHLEIDGHPYPESQKISDDNLRHLRGLSTIKVLFLRNLPDITDSGMNHAGTLPLVDLDVSGCKVTSDSLPVLFKNKHLRWINGVRFRSMKEVDRLIELHPEIEFHDWTYDTSDR